MTVKLIAENILDADDFYSATEQEGERWGQPQPASDNQGSMRPLVSGTPADFSYSGTATGDGAGDGTTVVDSALAAFGDDYFIGATLAITSGACNGESKTVTDFAQATGTLTTSAFSAQIVTGVTFTLTLPFDTRDFVLELVASGDPTNATFKWSHDNGTTYFGRDDPNQADWPGPFTIIANASCVNPMIIQPDDGKLLFVYRNIAGSGSVLAYTTSSDGGLTWAEATTITSTYPYLHGIEKLASGRILILASNVGGDNVLIYSDDDGDTWSDPIPITLGVPNDRSMIEQLANGNIIIVYENTNTVECKTSVDGGFNWSEAIVIAADAETQQQPTVIQAQNGDVICAYVSDEDSAGDQEIKCKISTDGGSTWGSVIDVINFTSDLTYPTLFRDINGRIYCLAQRAPGGQYQIDSTYSDDNGATWSTGSIVTVVDFGAVGGPGYTGGVTIIDGHRTVLAFCNSNDNVAYFHHRGYWEAYSANACVCAPDLLAQHLACGAEVTWYGGAGVAGDDWTFEAEYDFAMANLIEDSPSRPWRSEQDNIACTIVIDMGATGSVYADGAAFFGCNLRSFSLQMNATNAWEAPSVDETVSFDVAATGVLDSDVVTNEIHDAALTASYKDHELKGRYLRFTSGTHSGTTYEILDNVGEYILVSGDASSGATNDTFVIFQDHVAVTFTGGPYRYARISITAQHTADGYYQIGSMVLGRTITLSDAFDTDREEDHVYGVELLRTPAGGLIPVKHADRRKRFTLRWSYSDAGRREVLALLDYLDGKNVVLIPDSSDLTDVVLVKRVSDATQEWWKGDYATLEVEFEEVI